MKGRYGGAFHPSALKMKVWGWFGQVKKYKNETESCRIINWDNQLNGKGQQFLFACIY